MARIYSNMSYWTVEFTDSNTGLISEAGNETTYAGIILWAQSHLDILPKGEGKFIQKKLKRIRKKT